MSAELRAFLDRIDEAQPDIPASETVEDVARNSEPMSAHAAVYAERAGLDAGELAVIAHERGEPLLEQVVAVIRNGGPPIDTLREGVAAAWVWGFLWGAMWEQHRQLPDLEP